MTYEEAVKQAIEYFDQRVPSDDPSYWEFARNTRYEIATALRRGMDAPLPQHDEGSVK